MRDEMKHCFGMTQPRRYVTLDAAIAAMYAISTVKRIVGLGVV
jgi:hypothetical protein